MSWIWTQEKKPGCYIPVIVCPGLVGKVSIGFRNADDEWFDSQEGALRMADPRWWMLLPEPPVGG